MSVLRHPAKDRLRRWARVGAGAVRRALDLFPWTPLGLLVAAVAGAALHYYGLAQLDLVLLVVGYGALGTVALSVLPVIAVAVWLKLRLRTPGADSDEPLKIETITPSLTGFSVPSFWFVPLVRVHWQWEPTGTLARGDAEVEVVRRDGRQHEQVQVRSRGYLTGLVRRIVIEDVFGLCRVAVRRREARAIEVVPAAGNLRRIPILTALSGGEEQPHPMGIADGDRVELRRYEPGDPARFIHWKVFGRTRKLMIRVPERALSRARRTLVYQVAGGEDEASAGAARVAVEERVFGDDWTFSADGAAGDATSAVDAVRFIVRSRSHRDRSAQGLSAFVERAERKGPAALVIFAPASPGPWLTRVLAVTRKRPNRARIVIGVDGLEASPPVSAWHRLLWATPRSGGTGREALSEVLAILGRERLEVVVLDRVTGRHVGSARALLPSASGARRDAA